MKASQEGKLLTSGCRPRLENVACSLTLFHDAVAEKEFRKRRRKYIPATLAVWTYEHFSGIIRFKLKRKRETGKSSTIALPRCVFTKKKGDILANPVEMRFLPYCVDVTVCLSTLSITCMNLIHNTRNEARNYLQHVFSLVISSSLIASSCFALPPFWWSAHGERCEQSTIHPTRRLKIRGYTTDRFTPPRRVFDQRPLPPYLRNTLSVSMSVVQWNAKWIAVNELRLSGSS